ncbi:hypothetical protein BT93_G2343 [Corymbia citriodora subsp. variegata]|nr:hypothetical protein BT93_G2343 [Corymbia citriodora subsp. variegata]
MTRHRRSGSLCSQGSGRSAQPPAAWSATPTPSTPPSRPVATKFMFSRPPSRASSRTTWGIRRLRRRGCISTRASRGGGGTTRRGRCSRRRTGGRRSTWCTRRAWRSLTGWPGTCRTSPCRGTGSRSRACSRTSTRTWR